MSRVILSHNPGVKLVVQRTSQDDVPPNIDLIKMEPASHEPRVDQNSGGGNYINLSDRQPTQEFRSIFNRIHETCNTPEIEYIDADLLSESWKQYCKISERVVLEGETSYWIACAVYCCMVHRKIVLRVPYMYSLSNILKVCGVSPLEFFDKLDRWIEAISGSKRVRDQTHKIQGCLAVSAVVYKKFLPIFRCLFSFVDDSESPQGLTSKQLLDLTWFMFLVLKKSLPVEDLLSSYHLLLCVVETVYKDMCVNGMDHHMNRDFIQELIESNEDVLEYLCHKFEGVLLDTKHLKTHWYNQRKSTILEIRDVSDVIKRHSSYSLKWSSMYESVMLKVGDLDERMFLPTSAEKVFDATYDCSAIELLRRGGDDSAFADAELLLRISTQVCLEKLIDYKALRLRTPLTANSFVIAPDQLCPMTPLSSALHNTSKLAALVPPDWSLQGSMLEFYCHEMRDNPLPTIALNAENFGQIFADCVREEAHKYGNDYDAAIGQCIEKHHEMTINIFYVLMEHIVRSEQERQPRRDLDFCNVFRKEEFLASVFACALELLLFSYNSVRAFPWSVRIFNLAPVSFHKVIEVIIRAEPGLSRDMAKHLSRKEEEVLEQLAWTNDSPIWNSINMRADSVPSCEQAWSQPGSLSNHYTPIKRRRMEEVQHPQTTNSFTAYMFFRKVYFMSCIRLIDLCDRIHMDDAGKQLVWTLLEHVMRTETGLLAGRHLDQNLLCIVYVISKSLNMPCTFMDIMTQYRHQPQSRSQVYREVSTGTTMCESMSEDGCSQDSFNASKMLRSSSIGPSSSIPGSPDSGSTGEKIDLIMYYNKIFLPRVEDFVKRLDARDDSTPILQMPQPRGFGLVPTKKAIGDRVSVLPLTTTRTGSERYLRYNIQNSPRKDLRAINRMVNHVGQTPFYSVAEVPNKAAFGVLYRK